MTWRLKQIVFGAWVFGLSIKQIAKELKLKADDVENAVREVAKS